MRTQPFRLVVTILGLGLASLSPASAGAAPNCSGEACDALTVSADGCVWKNASDKAVKFLLLSNNTTIVSTVLAPGGNFREANKDACMTGAAGAVQYQASFASLRQMPDAPDFTLKPKPPVAVATAIAVPRAKPVQQVATSAPGASPPKPRPKPELPDLVAPAPAPAAAADRMISAPSPAEIAAGANPCGEACTEILFKRLDDCIWVQSQNPRPIMFQATVAGRMVVLALEGANPKKAAATPTPPEGAAAYHTRQHDPFLGTSDGIPVYRARLGDKGSCATDRSQISQFVAVFRK